MMICCDLNDQTTPDLRNADHVQFVNINANNITRLYELLEGICIEYIELKGQLSHLDVPDGKWSVDCSDMGLETIYVPDQIEELHCSDNNLKMLEVPNTIQVIDCENNQITEIKFRGGDPESLVHLNICDNKFETFDTRLPKTLGMLFISGNPNIRMKYLDCVFIGTIYFIIGDFDEVLFEGKLKYKEWFRLKLYNMCQNDMHYITLKDIEEYRM